MAQIRAIEEGDIPSYWRALDSVCRERKYLAFLEAPSEESTGGYVRANIASGVPHYVAVHDGNVIGWCDICSNPWKPVFRHVDSLGMGVVAEHRGKGIGRELVAAALAHARREGLTRIELEVFTSNTAAIQLYKKCGFDIEGTKRQHALFGDRSEDSYVMALLFANRV